MIEIETLPGSVESKIWSTKLLAAGFRFFNRLLEFIEPEMSRMSEISIWPTLSSAVEAAGVDSVLTPTSAINQVGMFSDTLISTLR